jgi:hypothetical protein
MPTETTETFYSSYDLSPSQCAEWLVNNSTTVLTHTLVAFGWMSGHSERPHPFHVEQVREHIARLRELLIILEAHIDTAAPAPVKTMTTDQNEVVF